MQRISVIGSSGAGKSTLAAHLAAALGLGHIELDGLYHLENWSHPTDDEFIKSVSAAMDRFESSHGGWTMCGDYGSQIGTLRDQRSDTIVWLDLPKAVVIGRVGRRTVRRALRREVLWNGNREPLTNFYRWDPEVNVVRWSWVNFDKKRRGFAAKSRDGSWSHLTVHRLTNKAEVDRFMASLADHADG